MSLSKRGTWLLLVTLVSVLAGACGGGDGNLTDRLLITRRGNIAEIDLATGRERLLVETRGDMVLSEPAVSPDGRRFAYVQQNLPFVEPGETVDLGADIFVASLDGGGPRLFQAHQLPNEQVRSPVWLPDGSGLLFVVQRIEGASVVQSVQRADTESGERVLVVEGGAGPGISQDGSRLAYLTQDENLMQTLWVADIDGTGATVLVGPDDGLSSFISPRFSPDGSTLAFGACEGSPVSIKGSSAPGRFVSRLPPAPPPAAAASYNGCPKDIWVTDLESGESRMIAELGLDQPSLAWSGDGARLYVLAGQGLFALDPDDGEERLLADGEFHGQLDLLTVDEGDGATGSR